MIRNEFLRILQGWHKTNRILPSLRHKSTALDIEKMEQEAVDVGPTNDDVQLQEEIERKRNKSRLKECDRNFLHEKNPYLSPTRWHQGTLKYMRRLYGRYGAESGVDPSICWPVKEEFADAVEYERVAYPFTIPQMIDSAKAKKHEKNESIRLRQENIVKKLEKLEDMKRDLQNRIRKKEGEALAARARKERLVEEVRMHFGYTVDPRDEKFKEMLEKKEKEQKKVDKEAKRKAREENLLSKMLTKKTTTPVEK